MTIRASICTVALLLLLLAAGCREKMACVARIEHLGTRIDGRRLESELRVGHDAGARRLAWVYFEYRIRYAAGGGELLWERGVFRRRVPGAGTVYTLVDLSLADPARVESLEVLSASCSLAAAPSPGGQPPPAGRAQAGPLLPPPFCCPPGRDCRSSRWISF